MPTCSEEAPGTRTSPCSSWPVGIRSRAIDEIARGIHAGKYKDYADFSIGFMTRGCFRHCSFCVNQCSNGAVFHAHLKEFLDPARKMIYLWDDNILSYPKWREVFEELAETGKRFQFN